MSLSQNTFLFEALIFSKIEIIDVVLKYGRGVSFIQTFCKMTGYKHKSEEVA